MLVARSAERSLVQWLAGLAGWLILLSASSAHATSGLDWLATDQSASGAHGESPASIATPVQSTAEVLRAYQLLGETAAPGFSAALGYLNLHAETHAEYLARKILINVQAGYTVDAVAAQLLSSQNDDGGFGDRPGYASSVLDTALALEALAATNDGSGVQAMRAVAFLRKQQQGSGGWVEGANEASVYLTAASMRALLPYRTTAPSVAAVLTGAQNFLLSRRGADGLWGEDFLSALALLAVVPNLSDVSMVADGLTALQSHQLTDGSWASDSYTTALVLQAERAYASRSGGAPASRGSISGYVVRAYSTEPIVGALVTVGELPGVEVLTNGEGYYVLPGLEPGTYTLTASKAGYVAAGSVVGVTASQTTLANRLMLDVDAQTGVVRGKLFDAVTRAPLQSVQVVLSGGTLAQALTDSAGGFDFGPVSPGSYSLSFTKEGYATLTGGILVEGGQIVSTQMGLTPFAGHVDGSPGMVSGRVVDGATQAPIAGATVDLGNGLSTLTTATGAFSFASVPRASYQGTVSATGYQSISISLVFGAGNSGDFGTLPLLAALTTPPPASTTGQLVGSVFDAASHAPLASVQVSLSGTASAVVLTSASGGFDFGPLVPGNYTLSFTKPGYTPQTGSATIAAGQLVSAPVGLTLSPLYSDNTPGPVSGRVLDGKTGLPLAGASFALGGGLSALTAADGSFRIPAVPRASYSGLVSATGYQSTPVTVVFMAGSTGDFGSYTLFPLETTPPPAALTVRGQVADSVSGAPVGSAVVTLVETGTVVTTGADGKFILTGITLKTFNLSVSATGYLPHTETLRVAAFGETAVGIKLSPPPPDSGATTTTLAGVVRDADSGSPIPGAQVSVVGTSLSALADATGHYSLAGVTRLDFSVSVSSVGYRQAVLAVTLHEHGSYTLDPTLHSVPADSFQIVSLSANQTDAGADSTVLFSAQVKSLLGASQSVLLVGEVRDGAGKVVASNVAPYAQGTTETTTHFTFAAGESQSITVPWKTARFAPGTYTLTLRVVQPGTITRANPVGEVLTEQGTSFGITSTLALTGALDINPPLVQSGLGTSVSFKALVGNAGNTPLAAGLYTLTVLPADTDSVLFTADAAASSLEVSGNAVLDFGSWVPTQSGNLRVFVKARTSGVTGGFADRLYVGDKASGTFTVSQTTVPEGTQTVRGHINLQGVDTAQGHSSDPLFTLVQSAVTRGAAYTAPTAMSWNNSQQCLGCHIQSQAVLGLSSLFGKVDVDRASTQILYDTITSSQWADGALFNSYEYWRQSQTMMELWSLRAWPDIAGAFRTKYKAAKYLLSRKNEDNSQVWWTRDFNDGWWNSDVGYASLALQGLVSVVKDAETLGSTPITDYSLTASEFALGTDANVEDTVVGPDGFLYLAKSNGTIDRMDLTTGTITSVATGLTVPTTGVVVAADGTLYALSTTSPNLLKINPDGTRQDISYYYSFQGGVMSPDGVLYLSDGAYTIYRRYDSGYMEVYLRGGLLDQPYGLIFDSSGNLLVANRNGTILKVEPNRSVSYFARGIAHKAAHMAFGADNSLYVTNGPPGYNNLDYKTEGLVRVKPDGRIERILQRNNAHALFSWRGQIYLADNETHTLRSPQAGTLDTSSLSQMRDAIPKVVRYLIDRQEDEYNNSVRALRLIGLGEARRVVQDSALLAQIDATMAAEDALLRSRQHPDGGWSLYAYYGHQSDPMYTALVGLALEYLNPSSNDPVIRSTIRYLLDNQRADGAWGDFYGASLETTGLVMVFMPQALDRLGGLDVDLHLKLPTSVALANPTPAPTTVSAGSSGSQEYVWKLPGVKNSGREVSFDLTLSDMALDEHRPVATAAYLEFANSFLEDKLQLPLDIPVVSTASSMTLGVAVNKALYSADEPVVISSTVTNTGPLSADGQVLLSIRASGSTQSLVDLPAQPFSALGTGAQRTLSATWNTAATLVGTYEVHARLLDAQGRLVAEAVTPFAVGAPAVIASTQVTTDKPGYNAWDVVRITGRVRNDSRNAFLGNSRVELTVQSPLGDTLYFDTRDLNSLAPAGLTDVPFKLNLVDALGGAYPVTLVLKDAVTRAVLSTSTTLFQVTRQSLQGVTGTVAVASPLLYTGEPDVCTDTARTVSASSVTGVTLTHQLVNITTGVVVNEVSQVVDLVAGGTGNVYVRNISSTGIAPGNYACVLKATLNGATRTLASAGFQVLEPPIKLYAGLSLNGKGRVLVLLDKPSEGDAGTDADPYGPEGAPGLTSQRAFLQTLLTAAGWSYTLTDSAEDFASALHSGGYSVYALFAEQVTLSTQVQKELREAVFRGEGLLVSGDHDTRHALLEDALEIEYAGSITSASSVTVTYGGAPSGGQFNMLTGETPLRMNPVGAESLGYMPNAVAGQSLDALVLNSYGRGRSAVSVVDLLAIATRDGQTSLAADTLRMLLTRMLAPNPYMGPNSVLPITLTVANLSIAVSVTGTVTVPAAASIADPGLGQLSGQGVTYTFPLAVDAVQTPRLWVRLPAAPGPMTLSALISGSAGGHTVTVTPSPSKSLYVGPVEELGDIRDDIDALVDDGNPESAALTQARNAVALAISATPQQAPQHVMDAADALLDLDDPDVVQVRVKFGLWLRRAGLSSN